MTRPRTQEGAMKRTIIMIALALVVGVAFGAVTSQVLLAQQAPVTRTTLQQKDIEGAPGKEVIMYVADIIPGGAAGRHFHPGPEVAYILEGSFVLEPEGKPPVTRSEEHTSELQSPCNLVCRLLLEKKKTSQRESIMNTRPRETAGQSVHL